MEEYYIAAFDCSADNAGTEKLVCKKFDSKQELDEHLDKVVQHDTKHFKSSQFFYDRSSSEDKMELNYLYQTEYSYNCDCCQVFVMKTNLPYTEYSPKEVVINFPSSLIYK